MALIAILKVKIEAKTYLFVYKSHWFTCMFRPGD